MLHVRQVHRRERSATADRASREQVDQPAVAAARRSFETHPRSIRATVIGFFCDTIRALIEAHRDEFVRTIVAGAGFPPPTRSNEVSCTIQTFIVSGGESPSA